MRPIPPAILDAISASNAQPTISVQCNDLQRRVALLSSLPGPVARTAAIFTGSGAIVRAAVSQSNVDPQSVTIFRIPSTGLQTASAWAAGGTVIATNARKAAGAALVQTGSTIRCFYHSSTVNQIVYRDSADDGQTWGAEAVVGANPGLLTICSGIAAVDTTDVHTAWYAYPQGATAIYRSTYSAGAWHSPVSEGPSAPPYGPVRGLAAESFPTSQTADPQYGADPLAGGAGMSPGGTRLGTPGAFSSWWVFLGGVSLRALSSGLAAGSFTWRGAVSGNTVDYSPWNQVLPMDTPDNGLGYSYPTVHYNGADGYYYAGLSLRDDGTITGQAGQVRIAIYRSATGTSWQHFTTLGYYFNNECHIMWSGGVMYAFDNNSCLSAPGAAAALDLSNDVLDVQIHETSDVSQTFALRISNKDGQYNGNTQIRDNAQLTISLGYNGTVVATHTAYVDGYEYLAQPSTQELHIHGRCLTKFLDQISPVLLTYYSNTVKSIAIEICRHANVRLAALPTTTQFGYGVPNFTIVPGESYYAALLRLGKIYDFEQVITGSPPQIKLVERSGSDASTWTYGSEALAIGWGISADQPNIVRVVGSSPTATNIFAEVLDTPNIHASGARRYRQIVDRMCNTSAKCLTKAQLALRDDQTQAATGTLTVTLNPQHEVQDVITVTDARVNLNAQRARINAITTVINFANGDYYQVLDLELP